MSRALVARSIEVIKDGQAPSGAYYACPAFENYRYSWFRDGSFVADAMSLVGERESAEAFFDWGARVIEQHHPDLHARYTVDGEPDDGEWPKKQWDGYGLFLWAMARHSERHGIDASRWRDAVDLTADWLADRWREPCVDWWEEREGVHPATVACIWAGLAAADHPEADAIEREYFAGLAQFRPDASMLAMLPPIGPCDLQPILDVVKVDLSPGGGLHRNGDDTYYGGGEWLLLTAMLGIVEARSGWLGKRAARKRLAWVEAHATPEGLLPEQSQDHLLDPSMYQPWVEKWGPPPCPLLWSHAMHLALAAELGHT